MPWTPDPTRVALSPAFDGGGFDALQPRDLVADEVRQRRETGYDVDAYVERANRTDPEDRAALLAIVDELDAIGDDERGGDWPYVEPEGWSAVASSLDPPAASGVAHVDERIGAGWLGRIAGCNLGKPVELGTVWTVEHIEDYLRRADAYPLRDYVPLLDPMPEGFELRESWRETTRGNVDGSARDDDIDYAILALHLLETHGAGLTTEHVGDAWLSLFPVRQVYTAERAAYVNLVDGLRVPDVARRRNPYREWIGAQIRGDVFGFVHPGDPWSAAALASRDATLSHTGNGVYGEMWAAALVASAFAASDAREAVEVSLAVVPPGSRLHEAVRDVLAWHGDGHTWEQALARIRADHGHYSWVHTVNNAAVVAAALLWADGDWATAVGQVVMSGWDTDSNGATVGSVAGVLLGRGALPERFAAPLHDRTRSALFGFDHSVISDLAERTARLAGTFPAAPRGAEPS